MPPKKPHTETEFRIAADKLLANIRRLGERVAKQEQRLKRQTIGLITEDEEKGPHYETNIIAYLDGLDRIKNNYSRKIEVVAAKITESIYLSKNTLSKKQSKNYRRNIWLEFAGALEPLGGRPSKKVAALLIDNHDRLAAWDVNHLCYGIERFPELYVKDADGGRGHHLWCAERNVIAKFLGVGAVMPASRALSAIHAAIDRFTHGLIGAAIHHPDLGKYTLVSSHYPCVPCAEVIAPKNGHEKHGGKATRAHTVREIIACWNEATEGALVNPVRQTAAARRILSKSGIHEVLKKLRNNSRFPCGHG